MHLDANNRQRLTLLKMLDYETAAQALEESDMETRVKVARYMNRDRMAHIIGNMAPEEAADLLGELSTERATELLGLMSPEFVTVQDSSTVGAAVEAIRARNEDVWAVYYVYVGRHEPGNARSTPETPDARERPGGRQ